jgi:hypothetical protein
VFISYSLGLSSGFLELPSDGLGMLSESFEFFSFSIELFFGLFFLS